MPENILDSFDDFTQRGIGTNPDISQAVVGTNYKGLRHSTCAKGLRDTRAQVGAIGVCDAILL